MAKPAMSSDRSSRRVSLAPLNFSDAVSGLLQVKPTKGKSATKSAQKKRRAKKKRPS